MAVALDHLRRHRGGLQIPAARRSLFGFRSDVREGADRAGDLAHAQVFGRGAQALQVAPRFLVPDRELQSEGDGLGVHAVGAADLTACAGIRARGASGRIAQRLQVAVRMDRRGLLQQQRLRRIHHVVRGEPVVQPARASACPAAAMFSATAVVKAMTSCFTSSSISQDAVEVEAGVRAQQRAPPPPALRPGPASASEAASSTSSHCWNLFWSLQIRPISGRVYRAIMICSKLKHFGRRGSAPRSPAASRMPAPVQRLRRHHAHDLRVVVVLAQVAQDQVRGAGIEIAATGNRNRQRSTGAPPGSSPAASPTTGTGPTFSMSRS